MLTKVTDCLCQESNRMGQEEQAAVGGSKGRGGEDR
jgi:hypothetical protein